MGGNEYRVEGLEEGTEYTFRVCASNQIGRGEWSSASTPIVARPPILVPGKVLNLEVVEVTRKSIALKWETPVVDDDFGKPVTYNVQKTEHVEPTDENPTPENPDWSHSVGRQYRNTDMTMGGLEEGKKYYIRVCGENAAGQGEYTGPEEPILARDKLLPPFIDFDAELQSTQNFKAGQQMFLNTYVSGRPRP